MQQKHNLTTSNFKTSLHLMKWSIEWKGNLQNGRKYMQIMYLIRSWYLEYIEFINGQWCWILQKGYMNKQEAYGKMPSITNYQEMQIKTMRYYFIPSRMATIKRTENKCCWGCRKIKTMYIVCGKNGTVIMENSKGIPQEIQNRSTTWSRNPTSK
jgi:hypothetical protein